jgi:hypothetical protein
MDFSDSSAVVEPFPDLKSWCERYSGVSCYLHFERLPQGRFLETRHDSLRQISAIITDAERQISISQQGLIECSGSPPVSFCPPLVEDSRILFFLREQMFISKKIQKLRLRLFTLRYEFFVDRLRVCHLIERLLNGTKIPSTLDCRIDERLSAMDMPASFAHKGYLVSYLKI